MTVTFAPVTYEALEWLVSFSTSTVFRVGGHKHHLDYFRKNEIIRCVLKLGVAVAGRRREGRSLQMNFNVVFFQP